MAEAICEQACLNSRLKDRVAVIRVGQLCGDTINGVWNMTEAWPLMLSTVNATKSLPVLQHESLAWLPVDVAAEAILQVAFGDTGTSGEEVAVYHVLNEDRTSSWTNLLDWMKEFTTTPFEIVPAWEWVRRLEKLQGADADHPAKKLLGLWKNAYCADQKDENKGCEKPEICFDMQKTKQVAPVMRDAKPIGKEQFEKMWRWIENEMRDGEVRSQDVEKAFVTS